MGDGSFVVHRNNTGAALTVNFGAPTGTATSGVDYTGLGSGGSVTIAAGAGEASFYLHAIDDAIIEPTENVFVALTGGSGYTVYSPNTATILIYDNDPPPTIDTTVAKSNILLNANNDNWQPPAQGAPNPDAGRWKSAKQTYIPATRDFDATNLWKDDPDLVALTVTIGGGYAGTLEVGQHNPGEGSISFWVDKKKTARFTTMRIAAGQNPMTVVLYVEGDFPSSGQVNDLFARAKFTLASDALVVVQKDLPLTVGPIVNSFSATESTVRFVNGVDGRAGLEGGKWLGAANPGTIPGMKFDANVTNYGLGTGFIQNITDVKNGSNGSAAGAVDTVAAQNKNVLPTIASGIVLPGAVLDSQAAGNPLMAFKVHNQGVDQVTIQSTDNPFLPPPVGQGNSVNTYDVRKYLKTYLVVQYADQSLYTIGYRRVGSELPRHPECGGPWGLGRHLNAASAYTVVSVGKNHDDVAVTVAPIANGNLTWQ